MNRAFLTDWLQKKSFDRFPEEKPYADKMLDLLKIPECFERSCFPGHFTGSALVVSADGQRGLFTHHRFLDKWIQFGGHCDGDENILRVAQREALEESGIKGLIVASDKPFDLDIHPIPASEKRKESEHFHYDVRFVLIAPESATEQVSEESIALRWMTPEEILSLNSEPGMVRMVQKWKNLLAKRSGHTPANKTQENGKMTSCQQ